MSYENMREEIAAIIFRFVHATLGYPDAGEGGPDYQAADAILAAGYTKQVEK